MVLSTALVQLAKWCFVGCVVISVTFIVKHAAVINYLEESTEPLIQDMQSFSQDVKNVLDPDFAQCIRFPSKIFCLTVPNKRGIKEATFFRSSTKIHQDDYLKNVQPYPVYATLYNFSQMMWELNVEITLLEPSMLYCMLSDDKKIELRMRGFDILKHLGAENVINVAILESNSSILDLPSTTSEISFQGFRHSKLKIMLEGWTQYPGKGNLTMHHFFEKRQIAIHAVVLFENGNYLWHSGIPYRLPDHLKNYDFSMFGSSDSTYEKLQSSALQNDPNLPRDLRIPSKPDEFLLQIDSSKYISCNAKPTDENSRMQVTSETKNLELIFRKAFEELKIRLRAFIIKLFIFGDTFFDWYHNCGLEWDRDRHSLDFAMWVIDSTEINDEPLVHELNSSRLLKMTHNLGRSGEAREFRFDCLGIQVRLWYMYKEKNTFWMGRHYKKKRQYYVRHEYLEFKLCSGDFLGHKVQIPCEPETIFQEDYGTNWKNLNFSGKRIIHSNSKRKVFY